MIFTFQSSDIQQWSTSYSFIFLSTSIPRYTPIISRTSSSRAPTPLPSTEFRGALSQVFSHFITTSIQWKWRTTLSKFSCYHKVNYNPNTGHLKSRFVLPYVVPMIPPKHTVPSLRYYIMQVSKLGQ